LILYRPRRFMRAGRRMAWTAQMRRLRSALEEAFSFVTPLELSLVLSTLAVVFLVAANNHGELM